MSSQRTVGCQTDIAGYIPAIPLELVLQAWRFEVQRLEVHPIDREIRRLEERIADLDARRLARNVIDYLQRDAMRVQQEFPIAVLTREMFDSLSPQSQARHLAQIFRRIMD